MHRAGFGVVALLASWTVAQTTAEAQDIVVNVTAFEGRSAGTFDLPDLATTSASPVGLDECEKTITFTFSGLDATRDHLSFYEGTGCDDPTVRQDTTSTMCDPLEVPDQAYMMRTAIDDVAITLSDLLPTQCADGSGSGLQNVWVLALNNRGDTVSGAGQKVMFPLAFDFTPPSMVGSLQATGGEDVATLTWGGGEANTMYQIFLDPAGCTGSTPTSDGRLTTDPPDISLLVKTATGGTTTVPFPESVAFGTSVAVAIRGIDDSGNLGSVSNIVCVERFETTSWWDSRCGSGDGGTEDELCRDDGGTCAASPARSSGAGLGTLLMVAVAALVIRRRAR
jgi:hypothetical protein